MFAVGVYRCAKTSHVQHHVGQHAETGAVPKPQSTVRQQDADVGKRLCRQKSCCSATTTDKFCNAVCSQHSTVGMCNYSTESAVVTLYNRNWQFATVYQFSKVKWHVV